MPMPRTWAIHIAPEGSDGGRLWPRRPDPQLNAVWEEMCAANDRLYNAPILSVSSLDAATGKMVCDHSLYSALAAQHHPSIGDKGLRLLGVKGLITGRDRAGREHVLIARRGTQTRIYGGMWELCPGGGIPSPSLDARQVMFSDVIDTLVREAEEELGIKLGHAACDVVTAMVMDNEAFSLDLIMPVRSPGVVDPRRGLCAADGCEWEYLDAAWLAIDEVGGFAAKNAAVITPPTLAVWRWKGWVPNGK